MIIPTGEAPLAPVRKPQFLVAGDDIASLEILRMGFRDIPVIFQTAIRRATKSEVMKSGAYYRLTKP